MERQRKEPEAGLDQGRGRRAALRREVRKTVQLAGFTIEDIFPKAAHQVDVNEACKRAVVVQRRETLENVEMDSYYQTVLDIAELGVERLGIERRRRHTKATR